MIGAGFETQILATAPRPIGRRRRRPAPRVTAIQAIGTALPEHEFLQSDLVTFMKRVHGADARLSRLLDALYRHSAIERRYSCIADYGRTPDAFEFFPRQVGTEGPSTAMRMAAYRRAATPLAAEAARSAFESLPDFDPREITHLVVASCTGFFAPGIDVDLVAALGLSSHIARTMIGFQGCHAGLSSLRVADSICRADPRAVVLLVCVELCTLHLQLEPTEDNLLANSLFGDGACAVILCAEQGGEARIRRGGSRLRITRCASWLEPGSKAEMAWSIGDHGFEMRLSSLVPRLLGHQVGGFLADGLKMDADALGALRFWAVHPGGPAILDEIERALALDTRLLAPSRSVLRAYGNMSSPTVVFVLDRIWKAMEDDCASRDLGGTGIALAFGPGLTIEGILFDAIG